MEITYIEAELGVRMENIKKDVSHIDTMMNNIIKEYSGDLDDIMQRVTNDVINVNYPAINVVEKYFMELSNALYFACEKVEKLGVYDSVSKAKAQEVYNMKYLDVMNPDAGKKPTVAEAQAMSENDAVYDKTVWDIYNRAYKILKSKVQAAETMVSTLSKILTHRMQESQMTVAQTERVVLNEGNAF